MQPDPCIQASGKVLNAPNKLIGICSNILKKEQLLDVCKKAYPDLETKLIHDFYFCSE